MDRVCATCGFSNSSEAQFCRKCGAQLVIMCKTCGVNNELAAEFCTHCGSFLRQPEASEELPAAQEPVQPEITPSKSATKAAPAQKPPPAPVPKPAARRPAQLPLQTYEVPQSHIARSRERENYIHYAFAICCCVLFVGIIVFILYITGNL
jgi:ribosomal protein L40E